MQANGSAATTALCPAPQTAANPTELAQKLLNETGGAKKPNLSEAKRKLDAIKLQDGELGQKIRAEVEKLLTPVQRGQLASATYMQNGVMIDPNTKPLSEQFKARENSADRANYNALDKRYGDGNLSTDDSAKIQQKINEQIASGLPLDKFLALTKAVEKDWTAKTADFLANFSPAGRLLEAAQPSIAQLTRDAGLGKTEWGASLQKILGTPGTARAFNAGIQEGMLEGAKSAIVDIVTLAAKGVKLAGDVSPAGLAGDALRSATLDAVKSWLKDIGVGGALNAGTPSAKRGFENAQKLAEAGQKVTTYLATHTPEQVANDVKAKIGQMWEGIKADHAKAAAQGPEAEARWWGKIVGRATFEVASSFIPVAGQAGKVAKGAKAADMVSDAIKVADKAADGVLAGDKVADGAKAGEKALDALQATEKTGEAVKPLKPKKLLDTAGRVIVRNSDGTLDMARAAEAYSDVVKSNKPWSWADNFSGTFTAGERSKIRLEAISRGLVEDVKHKPGTKYVDFQAAGLVKLSDTLPEELWLKSDPKQFEWLDARIPGGRPAGYTWHHTEISGKMELVPFGQHNIINHIGGRSPGHWAHAPR